MADEAKIQLLRIKNGDSLAFEHIYDELYPILYSYVLNILENRLFVEDVLEDVFIKLWEKRQELNIDTSLKSYLFASAKNSCLDFIRKRNVRDSYRAKIEKKYSIEQSYDYFDVSGSQSLENKELKKALDSAIKNLPKKCRRVFKLSRFFKYKNKEIARLLKISENTVEMHIKTAIGKLRTALDEFR